MKIFIGADIVPTQNNYNAFINADRELLLGKQLSDLLKTADFISLNLETPLSDLYSPIEKSGPNLVSPENTINGLSEINSYLFTLANNHILDQGEQGLLKTLKLLNNVRVSYIGAGITPEEAKKPFIFEKNGKKVGFYNCAEHEFSIVTNKTAGANPYDALYSFDDVAILKEKCDYVVVLYHGGREHYRYPTPNLQRVCRRFIEKGASLVVCQHTHCVGCEEKYNDGTIVYGQGNFLFNLRRNDFWNTSILIELDIDSSGFKIKYLPLESTAFETRLALDNNKIIEDFYKRSCQILNENFVEDYFKKYANVNTTNLNVLMARKTDGLFYRILNRITKNRYGVYRIKKRYKNRKRLAALNYLTCEAHLELMSETLRQLEKDE